MMPSVVINLFGGPGTGKSTAAAELFSYLKWQNVNVELVDEYAKELTWQGRHTELSDQLYVVAKQNRKLLRLNGKVEYIITDSPLILALPYTDAGFYPNTFPPLLWDMFNSYTNFNVFLNRKKPFHALGRNQSYEESIQKDVEIKRLLQENHVPFIERDAVEGVSREIATALASFDSRMKFRLLGELPA